MWQNYFHVGANCKTTVGTVASQTSSTSAHDLLSGYHVHWCVAVLILDVHACTVSGEHLHDFRVATQGGKVKARNVVLGYTVVHLRHRSYMHTRE